MANMEILNDAVGCIVKYPEQHEQGSWVSTPRGGTLTLRADNGERPTCGTTLCLAGWIGFRNAPSGVVMQSGGWLRQGNADLGHVADFAQKAAELTKGQADALFLYADNFDQVKAMVECLADNPDASRTDLINAAGIY